MNVLIIAPLLAASFGLVADGVGTDRPVPQTAWLVELDVLQARLADPNLRVIDTAAIRANDAALSTSREAAAVVSEGGLA